MRVFADNTDEKPKVNVLWTGQKAFSAVLAVLLLCWVYTTVSSVPPPHFRPIRIDVAKPAGARENPFLFFVHSPKTGGQTFSAHLRTCFGSAGDEHAPLQPRPVPTRSKTPHLKDLEPPKRVLRHSGVRRSHTGHQMSGGGRIDLNFAQVPAFIQRFQRDPTVLPLLFKGRRYGVGHCDINIVDHVGDRRVELVTVLRDPVARVKSLYYYLMTRLFSRGRRQSAFIAYVDGLNGVLGDEDPSTRKNNASVAHHVDEHEELSTTSTWWRNVAETSFGWTEPTSLDGFVDLMKVARMDNYQTRALSGQLPFGFTNETRGSEMSGPEMLAKAKRTLDGMPFFGITERFTVSMKLFQEYLHIVNGTQQSCPPTSIARNKTPPFQSRHNTALDDVIKETEVWDIALYEYALERFDRIVASKREDDTNG